MDPAPSREPDRILIPLALPARAQAPAPAGFPVLATVAPMAGAVVLWSITGSPMALAFAAIGPLVAVASVLDGRRGARRVAKRGAADRATRLDELRISISARHEEERADAWRRTPGARSLVEGTVVDWRDGSPGPVVLGRGVTASDVRIEGSPADEADRAVIEAAGRLSDAPVLAAPWSGIGVVGPLPLARAVARALVVQVAHRCRPDDAELHVPELPSWSWARMPPHHDRGGDRVIRVIDGPHVRSGPTDACTIAVADLPERLPRGLESILTVEGPVRAVVRARGAAPRTVVPELLTEAEAGSWAQRIRGAAVREGVIGGASALPDRVDLASLPQPVASPQSRSSLRAAVGSTAHGPLEIDLVSGGPHAIVAGTTGSGKSEFLLAWLSAMAGCHPPTRVAFLLVDFKGGAAFEPLRRLPHVTGIVTDLDEAEAERAVLSLRAELRHRESVLRVERARDIVELAPDVEISRLVIVIDEFQAMVERFPDLGAVIADIAARGRSLGVHLVLASQRPNGVVREQVTANCPIRVSLRVMQAADSNAVVGTDAAASIRSDTPGRGIIDVGDGCPVEFQSAMVDEPWLEEVRRQNVGVPGARRPWVDPLPRRLEPERILELETRAEPASGAHAIGLVDEPDRQRHGLAAWTPQADGHLLVVGPPGSGRTTALGAVAWSFGREQPRRDSIVALGGPPSAVWDLLHALATGVRSGTVPAVLLIDDLDVRFREWPDDYRIAAMSLLESLLREGRPRGLAVAATIGQAHRLPSGLRESFGSTLFLRHSSRSDLAQAGGSGELWQPDDPAGSGQWRGRRVQLVDAPAPSVGPPPEVPVLDLASEARLAVVVSRSPRADAAELAAVPGIESILLEPLGDASVRAALAAAQDGRRRAPVIVGDADAWGASWSLAMQVREEATIIVHGGLREYRAFDRGSGLPPLLDDPAAQCWVIHAGAPAHRVQWPRRTTETDGSRRDRALNPHPNPQKSYDSDMNA